MNRDFKVKLVLALVIGLGMIVGGLVQGSIGVAIVGVVVILKGLFS
jgi:F0F1-type ATP synthase membrane subunit c/vacuolar-type H+-ATPase subunit K